MKRSTRVFLYSAFSALILLSYTLWCTAGEPMKTALLTFRFDDAYANQIPGLELLETKGLRATVYCITGFVGKTPYMSWDDIGLLKKRGHEIGSHSVNHSNLLFASGNRIDVELRESAEMLKAKGFAPESFAWPYGLVNPFFAGMPKKYYRNAVVYPVIISGGLNYSDADVWKIKSVVTRSADEFSGLVRLAVRRKAWMVACFHRIGNDGNRYTIKPEEFTAMVNFAAEMREKGLLDVVTVSEGAARIRGE